MPDQNHINLCAEAWTVIREAAAGYGIRASATSQDNYNRIWARDTAVTGIAILAHREQSLFAPFAESLHYLRRAAAPNGQIPSNVSIDQQGNITAVSYGGPVGRTDCSFWWVIASVMFLREQPDESFKALVFEQSEKIFKLSESWEFNYQGLMNLPVSSNWADEYVTGGYVLYDQLLRYWALQLAGDFFERTDWLDKSQYIKTRIKQHYCFEAELNQSLYTSSQREGIQHFSLSDQFVSSFTATQVIQQYDCWSASLLILLNIPSAPGIEKLVDSLLRLYSSLNKPGLPAFWPVIKEEDPLYPQLLSNHSFRFKNKPGHFHNGGIWPVTNAFLIMALQLSDHSKEAGAIFQSMEEALSACLNNHPFPEYFDLKESKPQGVPNLCFSAGGYLMAYAAMSNPEPLREILGQQERKALREAEQQAGLTAKRILQSINLPTKAVLAISVAGESGCGKTTLSAALQQELIAMGKKVLVLHQDDYFKLPPRQNHQQRVRDFSHIGTSEVSLDLLDEHILKVKNKTTERLLIPVMNWATDAREFSSIDVRDIDVLLVEGTYTTLLEQADIKIFMTATYVQTRQNRIKRNRETVTDFIEKVLKKESDIIQAHQHMADLHIGIRGEVERHRPGTNSWLQTTGRHEEGQLQ